MLEIFGEGVKILNRIESTVGFPFTDQYLVVHDHAQWLSAQLSLLPTHFPRDPS